MTTALPHEVILDLATQLNTDADAIFEAFYSLSDLDTNDVVEAMQSLDTANVGTLRAYLAGAAVLEDVDSLWMEAA